jgi:hypothetical protein
MLQLNIRNYYWQMLIKIQFYESHNESYNRIDFTFITPFENKLVHSNIHLCGFKLSQSLKFLLLAILFSYGDGGSSELLKGFKKILNFFPA